MPRQYAEDTRVTADQSRQQILDMLRKHGADKVGFVESRESVALAFEIGVLRIRFTLNVPSIDAPAVKKTSGGRSRSGSAIDAAQEQLIRTRWRLLHLNVKAKLEAIAGGVTTFEQEFHAGIILADGRTMGEWSADQIRTAITSGKMPPLLPGS